MGGGSETIGPIVSLRSDEELAKKLSDSEFCDGDGGVVAEHEDPFAGIFFSDPETMHFPRAAGGRLPRDSVRIC